ncbi:MAG: hypothetical protein IKT09_06530 [Synergistes sp.]|nr:hypothetical protein [Synergistes sp.]
MNDETLELTLERLTTQLEKFEEKNTSSHKELFKRLSEIEKTQARLDVVTGGVLFIGGLVTGVILPKLF